MHLCVCVCVCACVCTHIHNDPPVHPYWTHRNMRFHAPPPPPLSLSPSPSLPPSLSHSHFLSLSRELTEGRANVGSLVHVQQLQFRDHITSFQLHIFEPSKHSQKSVPRALIPHTHTYKHTHTHTHTHAHTHTQSSVIQILRWM